MLQQLCIKNFTIIEQMQIDFHAGMSAFTGETGAGKSICIDALALLLGARADSKVIRHGAKRCEISAIFTLTSNDAAQKWLNTHDLYDDQDCILRRCLNRDGRTRNYINDQAVTLQQLHQLGQLLVTIHGQHEHQQLLHSDKQRNLLDAYANNQTLLTTLQQLQQAWLKTNKQLEKLRTETEQRQQQLEFLRYQWQELADLELQQDEFSQLAMQQQQLASSQNLLQVCQQILRLHRDGDAQNTLQCLQQSQQSLTDFTATHKPLQSCIDGLQIATIQIEEACHELAAYADSLTLDPQELQRINERMSQLHTMARKHHVEPDALLNKQQQLHGKIFALESSDQDLVALAQTLQQLEQDYKNTAQQLTMQRQQAASKLSKRVSQHMQELAMPGGQFKVSLQTLTHTTPSPHGQEKIFFEVSTNPGQALQALSDVVSGGELSRLSLALHVITTSAQTSTTLIFDEVDVGIGGHTAAVVGKLLQQLSQQQQIICITHLPQVAALATHHYQIVKHTAAQNAQVILNYLATTQARKQEIARMLSGNKITDTSLAHAEALLA